MMQIIALFSTDGEDASALLEKADIAMYSVKTKGKRGYQFYEAKFYNALREQLDKETEIRRPLNVTSLSCFTSQGRIS
jgi:predicted signal transduction protein with EAL and GGDEF domain